MTATMPTEPAPVLPRSTDPLGDPALHRTLESFVRRRVPASDVGDVVQTVLCDALASADRPRDPAELRKWLLGVARHKVVDLHRRAHREPPMELPEIEDQPAPMEARSLARWAEQQAGSEGDAQRTLDWMAREGEGEKLETIAAEEALPAARVRQRVSRMRRWMKERWVAELAAVATLTLLALAAWWVLHNWRRQEEAQPVQPEPSPSASPQTLPSVADPLRQARLLRDEALQKCDRAAWQDCLDELDRARGIDPVGDQDPAVGAARVRAAGGLRQLQQQKDGVAPDPDAGVVDQSPDYPTQTSDAPFAKSSPKSSPKPSVPVKRSVDSAKNESAKKHSAMKDWASKVDDDAPSSPSTANAPAPPVDQKAQPDATPAPSQQKSAPKKSRMETKK